MFSLPCFDSIFTKQLGSNLIWGFVEHSTRKSHAQVQLTKCAGRLLINESALVCKSFSYEFAYNKLASHDHFTHVYTVQLSTVWWLRGQLLGPTLCISSLFTSYMSLGTLGDSSFTWKRGIIICMARHV